MVINRTIDRQPCLPSDIDFWLQYGEITGYDDEACPGLGGESGTPGMKFIPPSDSSNGSYSFVQIVTKDTTTYVEGSNGKLVCPSSPGVDKVYPYPPLADGTTNDSPSVLLEPFYSKVKRTFGATMYMMWTSSISGSIPVPISSQAWQFVQASSMNSGFSSSQNWSQPVWSQIGLNGNATDYVATAPSTSPYGYPTWKHPVTPVPVSLCPTSNSTGEEETEEQ